MWPSVPQWQAGKGSVWSQGPAVLGDHPYIIIPVSRDGARVTSPVLEWFLHPLAPGWPRSG